MSLATVRRSSSSDDLNIVVIGNDALIEALPARPIQLAHACRAAGFDLVLPVSWGDEITAETTLRALERRNGSPAVLCACPIVRQRLLGTGSELAPLAIATLSPPVAAARYIRALYGDRVRHLAYVGSCPGARSQDYDVWYGPRDFLSLLHQQGIDTTAQPDFFDAVIPPDRRRFVSLPGGCPVPEALWDRCHERTLVALEGADLSLDLAQQLLARHPVLVDIAPALGCSCSGVTASTPGRTARIAVMSMEPPRAPGPVVDSAPPDLLEPPVRTAEPAPSVERIRPAGSGSTTNETPPYEQPMLHRGSTTPPSEHPSPRTARAPMAVTPAKALNATPEHPPPPGR